MGAPLPAVPNVMKVVVGGFIDGLKKEIWKNVLHFTFGGSSPSSAAALAIATQIAGNWRTFMSPEQPSPTTLEEVTVTDLSSSSGAEATYAQSIPGTRGDDSIPANAAYLVSYPLAIRYKGGHPRQYLYVLGNADFDGAESWSTAATAEVIQHWHDFLAQCLSSNSGGTSLNGFVGIRYHGKFLPNSGPPHYYLTTPIVLPLNIATIVGDNQIASQRRRIGRERGGAPEVFRSRRVGVGVVSPAL